MPKRIINAWLDAPAIAKFGAQQIKKGLQKVSDSYDNKLKENRRWSECRKMESIGQKGKNCD